MFLESKKVDLVEEARKEWLAGHIEWCETKIAEAKDLLAHIASGWRFYEGEGLDPLMDVTDRQAEKSLATIEHLTGVVAAGKRKLLN